MKNYKFGFSIRGFIAFILAMLPNIIWMIIPPDNDILANNTAHPAFEIVLNISQLLMIIALIMLINKNGKVIHSWLLVGLLLFCLAAYYVLWFLYFIGIINPWMLVGMAVFPTLYFILVELWIKNYLALIPSIIFGITHVIITCINYLK